MRLKQLLSWLLLQAAATSLYGQDICIPRFVGLTAFDVGENSGTSAVADFDGNGNLDLSVGLNFLLGDGEGGFGAPSRLRSAPIDEGFDVQPDDYDGDGVLDVAMVGFTSGEILFYWGSRQEGTAGFFEEHPLIVNVAPEAFGLWHIRRADFDKNGLTDIVAISFVTPIHVVLLNEDDRESRTFSVHYLTSREGGGGGMQMITTGDFDGDTNPDFISGFAVGELNEVAMFYGKGDGSFEAPVRGTLQFNASPVNGHRFNAADVDRDNKWDLFATGSRRIHVYFGKDFDRSQALPSQPAQAHFLGGASARFVETADMNLDGHLDFVVLSLFSDSARYSVFLGTPGEDGYSFESTGLQETGSTGDRGAVLGLGDLNGDHAPDIVITSETQPDPMGRVFLNDNLCIPRFPQGDANSSRFVDIADPLTILFHLFGGEVLPCPGAAEVDGVPVLDLGDAVYLLRSLFLAGEAPVGNPLTGCEVAS